MLVPSGQNWNVAVFAIRALLSGWVQIEKFSCLPEEGSGSASTHREVSVRGEGGCRRQIGSDQQNMQRWWAHCASDATPTAISNLI